jgi:hypothetical protein
MTPTEALQNHLSLCDELHQLTLEENRFLKQNQRLPEAAFVEHKRTLLVRLDESLVNLKQLNQANPARDPDRSVIVEKAKAKILQILHIDRENEQLLLRYSFGVRAPRETQPATPPAPSQVQRLYDRHT